MAGKWSCNLKWTIQLSILTFQCKLRHGTHFQLAISKLINRYIDMIIIFIRRTKILITQPYWGFTLIAIHTCSQDFSNILSIRVPLHDWQCCTLILAESFSFNICQLAPTSTVSIIKAGPSINSWESWAVPLRIYISCDHFRITRNSAACGPFPVWSNGHAI